MSGLKSTQVWEHQTFARIAVRAFPASTAWYLASVSGQSARTVEKHLRGEAKPGADAVLAYLNAPVVGAHLREALLDEMAAAGPRKPELEAPPG